MKEGDIITYRNEEWTILLIEDGVAHLINDNNGLAVLISELI